MKHENEVARTAANRGLSPGETNLRPRIGLISIVEERTACRRTFCNPAHHPFPGVLDSKMLLGSLITGDLLDFQE